MIGDREMGRSLGKWRERNKIYSIPVEETLFFRIIDSFQKAMKLGVCLIPLDEKKNVSIVDKGWHPFCEMIQNRSLGKRRCLKEISRAARIAAEIGEPYIFQCHADMIEFTAAISNKGQEAYAFVCGPMLLRHPDSIFVKDIFLKVQDLSVDPFLLMKTVPEIPVLSERRVQAAADLLFMVANYFSRIDSTSQRQKYDMTRQQALLAEGLFLRKKLENPLESFHSRDDFFKEKELIDLIKFGDQKKAKALLDELLGTALFRSHEHIGILKARVLEIIFIIARAAVEAGANLEEILGFNYQCIQNLSKDNSQETLYYFLIKAFEQLFEIIYQNRNIQHTRIFTRAKEYIWTNYNKDMTLNNLAKAVGISPYYLSHLFRKEMGISFLEYLTSVRLSIAKNLLINTTMTVMDICLEVGYQDPSHFAKMFKKKEGVHPTEYRKRG
ncbi:MAG: PocR ligand-binding domain-containing protein [Thermodesulfobacteriota bacterium]|jgi:two-component system response regulator YesN